MNRIIITIIIVIVSKETYEIILVTNLLGGAIFFQGFSLGGGSVLVSTADVDSVVTAKTTVTSKDISTQDT